MNLGPPKLSPAPHRYILKRRIYKRVLQQCKLGVLDWNNKSLAELKASLRYALRRQQEGRCIYCRRLILIERRNVCEDIEHFLDKSKQKYRNWSFSPVNLSVACHACNFVKTTRDMLMGGIGSSYPNTPGVFQWLHLYSPIKY